MSKFTEPYAIHSCPARTVKPAADFDRPAHQGFPGIPSRRESHPHLHQTQSKIKSPSGASWACLEAASLGFIRSPPKVSVRELGSQGPIPCYTVCAIVPWERNFLPLQAARTFRKGSQGSWVWGNLFLLYLMKYCGLFFPVPKSLPEVKLAHGAAFS